MECDCVKLSAMGKPVNTRPSPQLAAGGGPVEKAMELLEVLAEPGGPHRLAAIARRTGLAKPTVHRHLRTLAEFGFAEPTEDGAYRAGPRLLGLAATALHTADAVRRVQPHLADLRTRTGQLAYFAVRDGRETVCVALSEAPRGQRTTLYPGARAPLHAAAPGLALLSALPDAELDAFLDSGPHPALTPHTRVERAALAETVGEATESGYAVDEEFEEQDTVGVAAAVHDADGRLRGALALRGLAFTLDPTSVTLYGPMVRAAARALSAELGARSGALDLVRGQR